MAKNTALSIEQARVKVSEITDGLGKPVDPGISETVALMLVAGFITAGSCEGHLDWALPAPWIDVTVEHDPDAVPSAAVLKAGVRLAEDLTLLLDRFNQAREGGAEQDLLLGAFNGGTRFRIMPRYCVDYEIGCRAGMPEGLETDDQYNDYWMSYLGNYAASPQAAPRLRDAQETFLAFGQWLPTGISQERLFGWPKTRRLLGRKGSKAASQRVLAKW